MTYTRLKHIIFLCALLLLILLYRIVKLTLANNLNGKCCLSPHGSQLLKKIPIQFAFLFDGTIANRIVRAKCIGLNKVAHSSAIGRCVRDKRLAAKAIKKKGSLTGLNLIVIASFYNHSHHARNT